MKIQVVELWTEDLIMCPSQCYLKLTFEGRFFVIYLRWRYSDFWKAYLVETKSDYEITKTDHKWFELIIGNFVHDDYKQIQTEALKESKKLIYQR